VEGWDLGAHLLFSHTPWRVGSLALTCCPNAPPPHTHTHTKTTPCGQVSRLAQEKLAVEEAGLEAVKHLQAELAALGRQMDELRAIAASEATQRGEVEKQLSEVRGPGLWGLVFLGSQRVHRLLYGVGSGCGCVPAWWWARRPCPRVGL
jgi:hypothetical protein